MDPFVARSRARIAATVIILGSLGLAAALAGACNPGSHPSQPASGAVVVTDQPDAGTPDAGTPDAGTPGAGTPDAGTLADGGTPDAGAPDAGPQFGGQGPWPISNQTFTAADGLQDGPVVATSTDEAQNLWVATSASLYLMKPGDKTFKRFTSRDGLHLADNPVIYDEDYCGGAQGVPGSADWAGITTIVGGAANEVFIGYHGVLAVNGDCTDAPSDRHSGKLDRVRLQPDGTLQVKRLDMVSTGFGMNFWHNRTVYRMVYDHAIHPHTLYVGTDHGVDMMYPDSYRDPKPGEWTGNSILDWMSDHLHVQVCFHNDPTCMAGGEGDARMGDWRGLAIAPDGDLWHAGRWSAGKIKYIADLRQWNMRAGDVAYPEAFGNGSAPVFPVSQLGDVVSLSAVTVANDGTAWFASSWFYGNGPAVSGPGSGLGIAHYLGNGKFQYYSPSSAGMSEQDVQDMVALPDGRLVLAGASSGLVFWNPATGDRKTIRAGQGIPDDHVNQLELDTMVSPPALHVSTASGAATIRAFP